MLLLSILVQHVTTPENTRPYNLKLVAENLIYKGSINLK